MAHSIQGSLKVVDAGTPTQDTEKQEYGEESHSLQLLTLNASVVCCSRLLKCLRSLYGKQFGPRSDCSYRAVCTRSTLFASILNSSVMLGNYLQQTTSADDIFRCIFVGALRVKIIRFHHYVLWWDREIRPEDSLASRGWQSDDKR